MLKHLIKKSISLALAFAVVLSLSCCGVGDEALVDETTTESTTTATETVIEETTEETTTTAATTETTTPPETTTEETTQTTPEETTTIETTTHEITAEEAAILAELTDEEKQVWLTMPDIVTMRLMERYNADVEEAFSEFLYTEIICIDKLGQIKKITCPDRPDPNDNTISWLNEKISMNGEIELVDVVNIHSLIKFYSTFMCVDRKGKYSTNPALSLDWEVSKAYYFELYGIRSDGVNGFETLKISYGDAESIGVKCNYSDDWEIIDTYGSDTFKLYFKLDPLMKDLRRDWVVN